MLHFVIGCAIVVGTYYQWILPERRRKRDEAVTMLGLRLLQPEPHDHTPAGRRELNRLRRRAGWPIVPEPPLPPIIWKPAKFAPWHHDPSMRAAAAVWIMCLAIVVAYGIWS